MNEQSQIRAQGKRAPRLRKAGIWFAIFIALIAAGVVCCGKPYFLQGLVVSVGLTVLVALFAGNLYVLGILACKAGGNMLRLVRTAKPMIASKGAHSERTARRFLAIGRDQSSIGEWFCASPSRARRSSCGSAR
jgi:hypothetical protein